jgi:hypothetical protein
VNRPTAVLSVCLATAMPAVSFAQVELGCYEVTLGPWAEIEGTGSDRYGPPVPPEESADSVYWTIPSRIRLEDGAGRWPDTRRLSVPSNALGVPHRHQYWRSSGDSLSVGFTTGFAGTVSRFIPDGAGWIGTASTHVDVDVRLYQRPAELRPIDCGAPPVEPATLDAPFPRSVEVDGGFIVSLGAPAPSGLVLLPIRDGVWTVATVPTGLWVGSDTLIVWLDEERSVRRIDVGYPVSFDGGSLIERLVATYANVTLLAGHQWWNRSTRMMIREFEDRVWATLRDPRFY